MRPWPPSFSLANTNTVSPSAIDLPPYIVFWAMNTKVLACGSTTCALIAYAMIFLDQSRTPIMVARGRQEENRDSPQTGAAETRGRSSLTGSGSSPPRGSCSCANARNGSAGTTTEWASAHVEVDKIIDTGTSSTRTHAEEPEGAASDYFPVRFSARSMPSRGSTKV